MVNRIRPWAKWIRDLPSARVDKSTRNELVFKYMGAKFGITIDPTNTTHGILTTDLPVYPINPNNPVERALVERKFSKYKIDEAHRHPELKEEHVHVTAEVPIRDLETKLNEILATRSEVNLALSKLHSPERGQAITKGLRHMAKR